MCNIPLVFMSMYEKTADSTADNGLLTCAVWSVVLITEDGQFGESSYCYLGDVRHQVVGNTLWVFPNTTAFVSPNGVKVTQQYNVPPLK